MKFPKKIGIIMDGNRRFAKEIMKRPEEGHKYGTEKLREVLQWAKDVGVKSMTFYTLSVENINKRPKKELERIYQYLEKELDNIIEQKHKINEHQTRVRFLGRLELLPENLQKKINRVEEITSKYDQRFLNLAIAYGGQQEIVDAFKRIYKKIKEGEIDEKDITKNLIQENLYMEKRDFPDLIIRTGGDKRLSNFLLWESAYSELEFTEEKWPEFSKETFNNILKNYSKRKRRFGK